MTAQAFRIRAWPGHTATDNAAAIDFRDETAQIENTIRNLRIATQRHLAASSQGAAHGTFGSHAVGGGTMIKRCQQSRQILAPGQTLDTQRALTDCRQTLLGADFIADACAQSQPFKPCGGKDDGVLLAFIELAQAGLYIAAQWLNYQLRKTCA